MSYEIFSNSQSFKRKSKNLEKLNFNFSNFDVFEEYTKLQKLLSHEYLIMFKSMPEIMAEYDIPSSKTLFDLFKMLDIESRSFSECTTLTIANGKWESPPTYAYHSGWHQTWEDNNVYYRSSYELNYCKILDSQKISYLMEPLRILYYCSENKKYRIAIPDFLLPHHNLIVEIKSNYHLNKINMIDKSNAYKTLGYNFKLILDGKETEL